MTASQNILSELGKLGIDLQMQPGKLKNGHGEGVCNVLFNLCQMSLKNKFKFKIANIRDEGTGFGEDGDDELGGDEFEGNADVADMDTKKGLDESGDIDEDMDFGGIKEAHVE